MKRAVVWWEFTPWDSLLLRDPRPWSAPGGAAHTSLFPPPARTVAGAVRRAIADHVLKTFGSGDSPRVRMLLQRLCIAGPYLVRDNQLLHRVPAPLVCGVVQRAGAFRPQLAWRGVQGEPALTDAGAHCLPSELHPPVMNPEDLHDRWLSPEGFRAFCTGALPSPDDVLDKAQLFDEEPRTGHTGNRQTGAPQQGKLYSTVHLRLRRGVRIVVGLSFGREVPGPDLLPRVGDVRFGGEGRMATFRTVGKDPRPPWARKPQDLPERFMLYFRTPGLFSTGVPAQPSGDWRAWDRVAPVPGMSPGGVARTEWACDPFRPMSGDQATRRPTFRIISACSAPPQPVGAHGSGPGVAVRWLLAEGSILFCTRPPDGAAGLQPGAQLGIGRELGLGEVVVVPGWAPNPWHRAPSAPTAIHQPTVRS